MKTIIIYSTKHGTTEKCATMLSEKLSGEITLHNLKNGTTPDLTAFDKVVIGSSIYVGKALKEVTDYCTQNLEQLRNKRLGLFICCMFDNNAKAQFKASFPHELLGSSTVKLNLGGEMKFSDMKLAEKLLTKMVVKMVSKQDPNAPKLDTTRDSSLLIDANIDEFAKQMNAI